MKHLKRFNERSYYFNINVVREFCEESLAYLLDDGLTIRTHDNMDNVICINIDSNNLMWSDVKDSFIPFLIIINDKYNIRRIQHAYSNSSIEYTLNDLIDDKFNNDFLFKNISILIKEKTQS